MRLRIDRFIRRRNTSIDRCFSCKTSLRAWGPFRFRRCTYVICIYPVSCVPCKRGVYTSWGWKRSSRFPSQIDRCNHSPLLRGKHCTALPMPIHHNYRPVVQGRRDSTNSGSANRSFKRIPFRFLISPRISTPGNYCELIGLI